ncbi:hypothetical protein MNBD_GAMMA22-2695 [hydrothermal vent metagenome]|uniref:Uncharacterized protein n=1 Tax=hydrothermal vent metagenome TaxID=652676 RepID=A0A3B0ZT96_9ZZZZ
MPYFIYKISPGPTDIIKNLELLTQFEVFKEAKNSAKATRSELPSDSNITIKVIFADNELDAEEKLSEKREASIVKEWEK